MGFRYPMMACTLSLTVKAQPLRQHGKVMAFGAYWLRNTRLWGPLARIAAELWANVRSPFMAARIFMGHLFLATIVMFAVWSAEKAFHWVFGNQQPMFFDRIPAKWLFDASEVSILLVFIVYGTVEAINQLRQRSQC